MGFLSILVSVSGQDAEGIGKSGRVGQSGMRALRGSGVRDGDDTGDPHASRELDHIPPHLYDLRDGSCRTQHGDDCVRTGFADGRFGHSCG